MTEFLFLAYDILEQEQIPRLQRLSECNTWLDDKNRWWFHPAPTQNNLETFRASSWGFFFEKVTLRENFRFATADHTSNFSHLFEKSREEKDLRDDWESEGKIGKILRKTRAKREIVFFVPAFLVSVGKDRRKVGKIINKEAIN